MRKIQSPVRASSRSRDKLRAAAAALLDERDPADVTVTDLVAAAGVSRPTFYAAYDDLPAAWADAASLRLEEAFGDVDPTDVDVASGDVDDVPGAIEQVVDRLEPHITFFRRALTGPGGAAILRQSIDFLAGRILAVRPLGSLLDDGPLAAGVAAQAVAASVVWTAARWAAEHDDARGTRDDLVRDLGVILIGAIDGGLGARR
ncbi:TetR family transcriptional regulator [uncultured Corynebacterium sp.]|uniref:TetR family transcriptional regulator n=1 Tax=uncultured Corynebacterium sp. TaxID=159447 RepID=UPI0025FBE3AE|nr:TetR family transcriptional regulator [uncultured Corynebacterium sp.]